MNATMPLHLDETRCNACGACVTVCPSHCLAATPTGPWLARPLDCVRCAACVAVCLPLALGLASADQPGYQQGP